MIKYLINTPYGCDIIYKDKVVSSKRNNLSIIKSYCLKELFTYEGYIKAIKSLFGDVQLIPVVINSSNIFIPTKRVRDYDNIWINIGAVILIEDENNQTNLTFKDYKKLTINIKYQKFIKRVEFSKIILDYKNKLK
ncbi:MAG: hypothetical protein GX232_03565 [Acholeplasmataceae bacterium]|jgi:competence transcription factor ComK|nr:hypothetical protein [Acholeplasmataceae bacterium]